MTSPALPCTAPHMLFTEALTTPAHNGCLPLDVDIVASRHRYQHRRQHHFKFGNRCALTKYFIAESAGQSHKETDRDPTTLNVPGTTFQCKVFEEAQTVSYTHLTLPTKA